MVFDQGDQPNIAIRNRIKNDIKTYLSGDVTNSAVQAIAANLTSNVMITDYGFNSNQFTIVANSISRIVYGSPTESALTIEISFTDGITSAISVTVNAVELVENQANPFRDGD